MKTEFQKWKSIMAKLENELNPNKNIGKKKEKKVEPVVDNKKKKRK